MMSHPPPDEAVVLLNPNGIKVKSAKEKSHVTFFVLGEFLDVLRVPERATLGILTI
jgi:Trm5-related predicted tRNA methylase